ncbi:MAG: hypothetical protein HYZ45_03355 [Burkholderiales bacterium]|nr:hypothetical protein [Burkholderiales bacterium]
MKKLPIIAALAVFGIALFFAWPQAEQERVTSTQASSAALSAPDAALAAQSTWPPASPYAGLEVKRVPIAVVNQDKSAALSLMETRNGDPRTPPIQRSEQGEQPNAAELADPKLYQQYEVRQNLKLYAAFVDAAKNEVPRLRADIERGKQMGIAPEKIAKVEEKARRIEAMQMQLLKEHPELQR